MQSVRQPPNLSIEHSHLNEWISIVHVMFLVMSQRHWWKYSLFYTLDEYSSKITRQLSFPCLTSFCITHTTTTTTHTNLHAMSVSLRSCSIYSKKTSLKEDSHQQDCSAVRNSVCMEVGGLVLWGCFSATELFWSQVCLSCLIFGSTSKNFLESCNRKLSHQSYWDDKPCCSCLFKLQMFYCLTKTKSTPS